LNDDYVGDKDILHSIFGFLFLFMGTMVSWGNKKQPLVAFFSIEYKYMVLIKAIVEVVWL